MCSLSKGAGSGDWAGLRLRWRADVSESWGKAELMGDRKAPVQGRGMGVKEMVAGGLLDKGVLLGLLLSFFRDFFFEE